MRLPPSAAAATVVYMVQVYKKLQKLAGYTVLAPPPPISSKVLACTHGSSSALSASARIGHAPWGVQK